MARLRTRYEGRRVCVTGGAGFIGGHLVDALLSVGASISVIDDLSNSTLDHLGELIELEPERVRFVHGSILDDEALAEAIGEPVAAAEAGGGGGAGGAAEVVFHLGALGSVPRSVKEPQRTWSVNATGTVRVLEAARRAGTRRVVFAASSSAYGGANLGEPAPINGFGLIQERGLTEDLPPTPLSPYAASKVAGEAALLAWARSYELSTVSLRFFNIFGPRQSADSAYAAVVAAFAKRLLAGEAPVIYGDGKQSRDFTHVSNAVLACLLAGSVERDLRGEVINVGTGQRTTVLQLAERMAEACGAPPDLKPVFQPEREGDVRHSLADLTRARELLGYAPVTTLEAGLAETVAWYRSVFAGA